MLTLFHSDVVYKTYVREGDLWKKANGGGQLDTIRFR